MEYPVILFFFWQSVLDIDCNTIESIKKYLKINSEKDQGLSALAKVMVTVFFGNKTEVSPFQNHTKDLDPSY